ncbi:unnamed protein product [Effrenium voratum]|nr:unnamed protein product [Effrenium voratum]
MSLGRRLGRRQAWLASKRLFTFKAVEHPPAPSAPLEQTLPLARDQLLFLLDQVSGAGERNPKVWEVYSQQAKQVVGTCSIEELCRIVRALCRVQYMKKSLLNVIQKRLRSGEIQSLPPRCLAQLLSDLRRLRFFDGPMLQDILKHWRFQEKLEEFGAWDLSLLLIAFARASMRDKESVVAVGTALRQRSSDLTASTAAGSLYSLALLDFTDETGTFLAAKVLPRCLGHASQQELVNIAFALVVLDLPGAELFSFTLERLARQVSSLKPVEVHALRIVAHCVKFPDALQPAMRSSLEAPEARQRSTEALKQVLRATQNQVIECPPMSSRLQWALERYLDELHLPYVPEQAVGPYIPDFILPMNVAVEVDGFKHFYAYSQRLTAKSQLKRRILRAMGWGIVSLPHFVWLPMKHEERLVFLAKQVELASGASLSAVRKAAQQGFSRMRSRPFRKPYADSAPPRRAPPLKR